ncbi:MAG: DUF1638 domain-containing protein [Methanomassiliicoccales archaeon]|jgi:hypothetical protein
MKGDLLLRVDVNEAKGCLGIVGCPILEDEIVHSVLRDTDIANVVVIENDDSRNLLRKLRKAGTKAKVSSIKESELDALPQDGFNLLVLMKSMALHEDPLILRREVAKAVELIGPKCRSIMLFYGLCGNAFKHLTEIEAETKHQLTLLTDEQGRPVDDCIAAVLGGTDGYYSLLKRYPGVFYLTPAWAENWRELIFKMELTRGVDKGDLSMLKWMFDTAGYKKALTLDTGLGDCEVFEEKVEDFVREFHFERASLEKEFITLEAVDRSYDRAKSKSRRFH